MLNVQYICTCDNFLKFPLLAHHIGVHNIIHACIHTPRNYHQAKSLHTVSATDKSHQRDSIDHMAGSRGFPFIWHYTHSAYIH